MGKLNKKQRGLIMNYALKQYGKDNKAMFIIASDLMIYDDLENINMFENLDSDIERFYSDIMSKLVLNRGKA
jgi:hypothetical protein